MSSMSPREIAYLRNQDLGRIATAGCDGQPHVTPVTYELDMESKTIVVPGLDVTSKKFRDLSANPRVGFVVDDVVSREPFVARGIVVRGNVDLAYQGGEWHSEGIGGAWVRILPDRVVSWGLDGSDEITREVEDAMNLETIRHQFAYNRWATEKMLTAAQSLTTGQFLALDDTPFGSIRNELVHILDAQLGWIDIVDSALRGIDRTPVDLIFEDYPDLDAVLALWRDVEEKTARVLDSISPDDLETVIPARFDWGDVTAPLWVMLMHVVNHGTQHRSEAAMKLTNFGHSPGMVDLLFYWVESSYASEPAG